MNDIKGSAARVRSTEAEQSISPLLEIVPATEEPAREILELPEPENEIVTELIEYYKKTLGRDIAPKEILKHLAHTDIQIFGEQSAAKQESHAKDALYMSMIAPEELKQAMIFHDIGKAGPDHTDEPLSTLIANMYAYNFPYRERGKTPAETPIQEFLEAMIEFDADARTATPEIKREIAQKLVAKLQLKEDANMRDFYDAHVQWGVDLSKKTPFIENPTAFAAFGHHIIPGLMPRDVERIKAGSMDMKKGIIPVIEGFVPTIEDVKHAAGTQTLDYCNARFTRSDASLDEAAEQTKQMLFFAIDKSGYAALQETYGVKLNDEEISEVKTYIESILEHYKAQVKEVEV